MRHPLSEAQIAQAALDLPGVREVAQAARQLRVQAWLVGGAVRDLALRIDPADLDFVAPGGAALAERVAKAMRSKAFQVNEDFDTHRVAIRRGRGDLYLLDFSEPRGGSLQTDLAARDFTLNAVAVELNAVMVEDPSGGLVDLRRRTLRLCSPDSIDRDPLRGLRAFRFAATLGVTFASEVEAAVRRLAARTAECAGERLWAELLKILQTPRTAPVVRKMAKLGLLEALFPELKAEGDGSRGKRDAGGGLGALSVLDQVLHEPETLWPEQGERLRKVVGQPHLKELAKLVCLLRWACNLSSLRHIAQRLRMSRADRRIASALLSHHHRLLELFSGGGRESSEEQSLRRLFLLLGETTVPAFFLALADLSADRRSGSGRAVRERFRSFCGAVFDLYFGKHVPAVTAPRLIAGRDLIDELGLDRGPQLGRILKEVHAAQTLGEIAAREQALAFARELLHGS